MCRSAFFGRVSLPVPVEVGSVVPAESPSPPLVAHVWHVSGSRIVLDRTHGIASATIGIHLGATLRRPAGLEILDLEAAHNLAHNSGLMR